VNLSFKGEGEILKKRGFAPLRQPLTKGKDKKGVELAVMKAFLGVAYALGFFFRILWSVIVRRR